MKVKIMFVIAAFFLLSLLFSSATQASSPFIGDVRVSYLEGDAQVKSAETPDWVPASINMPLMEGDSLWVPEGGMMGIQLRDGSFVRLNDNTGLQILAISADSYQLYVSTGNAYVNFTGNRKTFLQMDTPASSVRVYDRSRFRVDVYDNGYTDVSVFSGAVYAESNSGETTVAAGKMLSLREDAYAELAPLGPPDEWERWNRDRDSRIERRYSSRYLPSELSAYSNDFDEYGRWVYTSEYGNCWTPRSMAEGWAPYRFGRWTWIGGDYVWVSYDSWGWAPYHYGRWAFVSSVGWCWVPPAAGAVYWGPGFVGWVNTPSYVAWVPLAPGEVYYGYGNYGPHSVNLINVNINTVHVTNVYRNVHVRNSFTVVNHDTFITGRGSRESLRENPFLTNRLGIGRPDIKPSRTSYMPVIKSIPSTKVPPQAIRQIQVRDLKERRAVVKNRSQSVLRPGTIPKPLSVTTVKQPRVPGSVVQPRAIQPRVIGREVSKPGTTTREFKKPGGAITETPKPGTTTREFKKPGGVVTETPKPGTTTREFRKPGGVVTETPKPGTTTREFKKPGGVITETPKPGTTTREFKRPSGAITETPKPGTTTREFKKPGGEVTKTPRPGTTTREFNAVTETPKPRTTTREFKKPSGPITETPKPGTTTGEIKRPSGAVTQTPRTGVTTREIKKPAVAPKETSKGEQRSGKSEKDQGLVK